MYILYVQADRRTTALKFDSLAPLECLRQITHGTRWLLADGVLCTMTILNFVGICWTIKLMVMGESRAMVMLRIAAQVPLGRWWPDQVRGTTLTMARESHG